MWGMKDVYNAVGWHPFTPAIIIERNTMWQPKLAQHHTCMLRRQSRERRADGKRHPQRQQQQGKCHIGIASKCCSHEETGRCRVTENQLYFPGPSPPSFVDGQKRNDMLEALTRISPDSERTHARPEQPEGECCVLTQPLPFFLVRLLFPVVSITVRLFPLYTIVFTRL